MAYKLQIEWPLTAPQEGEGDTVDMVGLSLREVSGAMLTKKQKAKLLSVGGNKDIVIGTTVDDNGQDIDIIYEEISDDSTFALDGYLHERLIENKPGGKDIFVTTLHHHPTPEWVPNADSAEEAKKLSKSFKIIIKGADPEEVEVDGTSDVVLDAAPRIHKHSMSDITDLQRIFGGTTTPDKYSGFPSDLRDGDVYIEYL